METRDPDRVTSATKDPTGPTLVLRGVTLHVRQGVDAGREARVDHPMFVVGSGESAHLRLTDDTVSREHLRIALGETAVVVRDPGSTNGTWVGNLRVHDAAL